MNKNAIQKRYIQLQGQLERISFLANSAKQLVLEGELREYRELSSDAARMLEKATVNMRELVLETTYTEKNRQMEEAAEIQGITIEHTGFWYKIVIPVLLPHKRPGRSCMFIETPLRYAISRYAKEHNPERLRNCVVCFRHVYSPDFPERAIRDHDNIETKKVLDVVADKLMVDDTGAYCTTLYTSVQGEKDATEIYVVAPEMFMEWLKMHPIE